LSRLVRGDYAGGWPDHEARWGGSETQMPRRRFDAAPWSGREPLAGKSILLHAEQGMGDVLMFARFAPLLHDRGARVVLEAHGPLAPLLQSVRGVDQVAALGAPLPSVDFEAALMSLPLLLGTGLDSIPGAAPYLEAPPGHLERWRTRLAPLPRPRVGLAWSGSTTLRNDRNRSIPLAMLAPLRHAGVTLVSLQKEIRDADRAALGAGPAIHTFEDEIADFRDTAALAAHMDVVVSVDTAVAHLAGALARPLWLLLPFAPDWRWLLDRDDSPWYPTARLFRQPAPGEWPAAIERVTRALRELG
jgi:hypothetical protein